MTFRRLCLVGALLGGCGDDETGEESSTVADGSWGTSDDTTMTAASTTATTTSATTTSDDTATTIDDTSSDTLTTTDATGTETTDASSDSGDTSPKACGEASCNADEVCVNPCCGGPAPGCDAANAQGGCDNGERPVPGDQCPGGCDSVVCCPMTPCVADPPYCANKADLMCTGTSCSIDSCFGTVDDDNLSCECA